MEKSLKVCIHCETEENKNNVPFHGRSCRLCHNKRILERNRERKMIGSELSTLKRLLEIRDQLKESSDEDLKISADHIARYLQRILKL
jgi:hypothetical protein